jgi:hypothetical protein
MTSTKSKREKSKRTLRTVIEQDAVKRLKGALIKGCKKHGLSQHRILGALYMMCLNTASEAGSLVIDEEWLKLLDSQVKQFDSLVDVLLERVEAKKA